MNQQDQNLTPAQLETFLADKGYRVVPPPPDAPSPSGGDSMRCQVVTSIAVSPQLAAFLRPLLADLAAPLPAVAALAYLVTVKDSDALRDEIESLRMTNGPLTFLP